MSRTRLRHAVNAVSVAEVSRLREQVRQRDDTIDLILAESFADLERNLSDPGWIRLSAQFEQEFTAEGLRQIRAICRLFSIKNSLIRRAISLRTAYVWGKGVEITARSNGRKRREQDVQAVVEAFLTDSGNQRAFTSGAARERLERCLGTDGEFFPVLFTRPTTGEVQVRIVIADEITEIICNPQDRSEPWYYRRVWVQRTLNADGQTVDEQVEQLHPDIDYRPKTKPQSFGRIKVAWNAPMMHIKVGDLEGWQRGVPDAYAAIDWAKAYTVFLEDWARLVKSLSRFAWKLTAKGAAKQRTAQTRLSAPAPRSADGSRNDVGATAVLPTDQAIEAIPKTGATIDSESGRPIAAMVAAAMDVPITMLLTDPGVTGARATAETLDKPTELVMGQRRGLWTGVYKRILQFAILESVRAPDGLLKGTVVVDVYGRESVKLNTATDPTIDINFPDLDNDMTAVVQAVAAAADTGVLPPEQIARLLLTALGVRDVDTILEAMHDDDGNFVWPDGPTLPPSPGPPSMQPDDQPTVTDPSAGPDDAPVDPEDEPADPRDDKEPA
ncbi:hypothetical protein [Paractinoplanes ferrugineus]|uniref:hypothetical protein n=1 Tax=Paractinoplanes ferrugineus TaxID=113564 RepID=UPI001941F3AF|nr:hypothetical protein [Actinoplanes ferrugineus]